MEGLSLKRVGITALVIIVLIVIYFGITLGIIPIIEPLNRLVAGAPDKSCNVNSDCIIKETDCHYCGCASAGDAVNKNWKPYCLLEVGQGGACQMCVPNWRVDTVALCKSNVCTLEYKPQNFVKIVIDAMWTTLDEENSGKIRFNLRNSGGYIEDISNFKVYVDDAQVLSKIIGLNGSFSPAETKMITLTDISFPAYGESKTLKIMTDRDNIYLNNISESYFCKPSTPTQNYC